MSLSSGGWSWLDGLDAESLTVLPLPVSTRRSPRATPLRPLLSSRARADQRGRSAETPTHIQAQKRSLCRNAKKERKAAKNKEGKKAPKSLRNNTKSYSPRVPVLFHFTGRTEHKSLRRQAAAQLAAAMLSSFPLLD